jgi:hypothetical protein
LQISKISATGSPEAIRDLLAYCLATLKDRVQLQALLLGGLFDRARIVATPGDHHSIFWYGKRYLKRF